MKKKIKSILLNYNNLSIVVKASLWFMIVTVIDKSVAIITQPIINRILSVDEVGVFGVYNSWRSIFAVLATFNLYGGVLEVLLTKESDKKREFVSSLCSLSIVISLVFWSVFFVFESFLNNFLELKNEYILVMACAIISDAIIQFWAVPKRFEYSYKLYSFVLGGLFVTKSVLSVILTFLFSEDRILGRILGLAIPSLVVAIVLLFFIMRNCKLTKLTKYWKKGFLFNLPLIPHYLSTILLASSDRIMIQYFEDDTSVGLYTIAYSYANLILIFFNAINNSYNPLSMQCIKNKDYEKLSYTTNLMLVFSVIFSILMMLFAPEGIWLLGGDNYIPAVKIIPILIIGIFFSSFYFVFSNIEFVYEKNKYIFPVTLVGAILNIGLNFLLIPIWGYEIAALTTLLGYIVIAILHYFISLRIIGKDVYKIKKILFNVLLLILGGGVAYISYGFNIIIRYIIVLALMVVIIIALKKYGYILSLFKKD